MAENAKPLILCVDDEPPVLGLLKGWLAGEGYDVLTSDGGESALLALTSAKPDLILLDVVMPDMDGYALCARLQEQEETANIPVLFVSALGGEPDKARAFALGAVDYVVKPLERKLLLDTVRRHMLTRPRWKDLLKPAQPQAGGIQPADFIQFKEDLAGQIPVQPEKMALLAKTPPAKLYAAASQLGLDERRIAQALSAFLKLPYVVQIDRDAIRLGVLPASFCKTHLVVAIREASGENAFVLSNPFDWELLDALKRCAGPGQSLRLLITEPATIGAMFQSAGTGGGTPGQPVVTDLPVAEKDQRARMIHVEREHLTEEEIEKLPVVEIADHILFKAVRGRASDIHVDPKETHSLIRFRVDGDLRNIFSLNATIGGMVISRFKAHAGMDIAERRKPQDGAFAAVIDEKTYKFRMATTSTPSGESVVLRILDADAKPKALGELGMTDEQVRTLTALSNRKQGLVLVVGETGSGKSTTLYSLFSGIDTKTRSLISIEDPVEYAIPFANQQQVNEKAGLTFEAALKSAMRQDPDILFLGEARDPVSTKMLLDFASTGHLTITSMHTSNATSAVFRLERLGITRAAMAETVIGIVAQRLLRKLCHDCKEIAALSTKEREMLAPFTRELPDEVARPRGCPKCNGGYRGREGVYEVLRFDSEIADMVRTGTPISEIRRVLYRRGAYLISHHAVEKVRQLLCPVDDVFEDVLVEELGLLPEAPMPAPAPKPAQVTEAPAVAEGNEQILIADDDADVQAMLKRYLENQGYGVTIAGDGVDALLYLGKQPFDLILSDLNMPHLDGFKLMEMMTQKGIRTPAIFLTGNSAEQSEQKCLELGAVDFLTKPIKKEVLLLRVKAALEKGARAGATRQ